MERKERNWEEKGKKGERLGRKRKGKERSEKGDERSRKMRIGVRTGVEESVTNCLSSIVI